MKRVMESPAVQGLLRRVEKGGAFVLPNCCGSSHAFLASCLHVALPEVCLVVVTSGVRDQERMHQDVENWMTRWGTEQGKPLFYAAWDVLPQQVKLPHADVLGDRLEVLSSLLEVSSRETSSHAPVIIASVPSLMQATFRKEELHGSLRRIQKGDVVDPLELVEWLEAQGYEPESKVTQKGEYAVRGGILDVYPLVSPWPIRLEFFGDEVESLREFDPSDQRSRQTLDRVLLPPGGEFGLLFRKVKSAEPGQDVAQWLGRFTDYLPARTIILYAEPADLETQAAEYERQVTESEPLCFRWHQVKDQLSSQPWVQVGLSEMSDDHELITQDPATEILPVFTGLDAYRPMQVEGASTEHAEEQRRVFFEQMHRWLRQGQLVEVFFNNEGEKERFEELWAEYGLGEDRSKPELVICSISCGFLYEGSGWIVVTDAEIFGRYKIQRARRLKSPHAMAARNLTAIDFAEMDEGDLVVHMQYGIGRYMGLTTLASGRKRGEDESKAPGVECLVIEYAASSPGQPAPKLYVPVTEAHLVGKYVGASKAKPPLNTLGGQRWAKAKASAEKAVHSLAADLLSIQAARESQQGYTFPPDTSWQREFEHAFLFEETPDQLRAIQEAKSDMESQRPMDRLICGDVGFGKTEVAIRTAFKSVMSGKQVAILVPTTVLAQQHYKTFRERMADYPVRVEMLSRFRSKREQLQIIEQLARGAVDIVVGTHRLVQPDVVFKDLGLVVIDEEQRFGVTHKERFKKMRQLVDVLTLSATPIPRTLHLALVGARAMSAIETPPHDRLPVETMVVPYDEGLIKDAIQREINRQGQVFFLHNRVSTIHMMADKLRALLPRARIVVGHGQMESDELEEVMADFVEGKADVLLSTTIIESGLDIPNANTIIIDRADRFGLSDLYQLRGRVGRYKHQAYAYLLLPRHAHLLTDARKRLGAIKQYSRLGSGFKIAMRDLEIRGAGNLLGSEQSGHIAAVGFELYCQLLKQSVAQLKGEVIKPRILPQVKIDFLIFDPGENKPELPEPVKKTVKTDDPDKHIHVAREVAYYVTDENASLITEPEELIIKREPAFIPLDYLPDAHQRIEVYRRMAQTQSTKELESLAKEMEDRFGPIPDAVQVLLDVWTIKHLAADCGVTLIEVRQSKLMVTRKGEFVMSGGKFPRLTKKTARGRLGEIRLLLRNMR